jgi:hypothetical protein
LEKLDRKAASDDESRFPLLHLTSVAERRKGTRIQPRTSGLVVALEGGIWSVIERPVVMVTYYFQTDVPTVINEPATPTPGEEFQLAAHSTLRVLTDFPETPPPVPPKDRSRTASYGDLPETLSGQYSEETVQPSLVAARISPSHLRLNHFGSRFIPHATSPIRCMLPIPSESLLLLGTDTGLSVLNLFPAEWTDDGLSPKGPSDAYARVIWMGEGCGARLGTTFLR